MEDHHQENPYLNNDGQETQVIDATQTNQALLDVTVLDSAASETNTLYVQGCHGKASGASIGSSCSSFISRPIPPFLLKIHDMLSNEETNSFVAWSSTGTSFVIKNPHTFAANVLPMYFKHNNFQSFITQLNSYGFKKINWEQWEYKNEYFQKGGRHLLRNIRRRKPIHNIVQPDHSGMEVAHNESPNSGNKETDTSMTEYNLLKTEMMKLKEKQQTMDEKLGSLKYQVARNERDQNRMMVAVERIQSIMHESGNGRGLKGKRKLGEIEMCSHDILGSKANVVAESNCEIVLVGEEIGKHPQSTFFSLEDLMGESESIQFIRELHKKIDHPKS